MKKQKTILTMVCLLILAACGKSGGSSKSPATTGRTNVEDETIEGQYKAILRPYNNTLSGWVPNGITDINVVGDEFEVKTWLDDSANVVHMQNIHVGTECPTMQADLNKDSFVDFNETLKIASKVIVPLDGNLNSQDEGAGVYPKGNYAYYQKASLASMMEDLKARDKNPRDHIQKLAGNQNFYLEGKVIIITGVAPSRTLPSSMSALSGQTAQASVPIACGVIKKMM